MESEAPEHNVVALTVEALSKALGDRLVAVVLFDSRALGEGIARGDTSNSSPLP